MAGSTHLPDDVFWQFIGQCEAEAAKAGFSLRDVDIRALAEIAGAPQFGWYFTDEEIQALSKAPVEAQSPDDLAEAIKEIDARIGWQQQTMTTADLLKIRTRLQARLNIARRLGQRWTPG